LRQSHFNQHLLSEVDELELSAVDELEQQAATTVRDLLLIVASESRRLSIPDIKLPLSDEEIARERNRHSEACDNLLETTTGYDGPSFALRLLVKMRLAQIIAAEIVGIDSTMQFKADAFLFTIDSLKEIGDKWSIPRRARRAFRAAAFGSLFTIGEREIGENGASAFFALNPFDFTSLFRPFVMALGDRQTMEAWLVNTELSATLNSGYTLDSGVDDKAAKGSTKTARSVVQNDVEDYFPVNPGNAVLVNY